MLLLSKELGEKFRWTKEETKCCKLERYLAYNPIWIMENGNKPSQHSDYDLSTPINSKSGLRQGLASYGDAHFSLFLRKAFIKAAGYGEDALSRPIIGIINTYSGFNPCHANVPQLIEAVKRGVQLHGGLAIDFPTVSLHESFSSPTSMYLRNLMSMDTEEMINAQPVSTPVSRNLASGHLLILQTGRCLHYDRRL